MRVHTPTVESVGGDVEQIETRVPPDSMHEVDLADALDEGQARVLLFSSPALCESRVCGPVTDVAEQVKSEFDDEADFIHVEFYEDNDASQGPARSGPRLGPQLEPMLFTIDADGVWPPASRARSAPTSCATRSAGRCAEALRARGRPRGAARRRGRRGPLASRIPAPRPRRALWTSRTSSGSRTASSGCGACASRSPVRPLFLDRDEAVELLARGGPREYPRREQLIDEETAKLLGLLEPKRRASRRCSSASTRSRCSGSTTTARKRLVVIRDAGVSRPLLELTLAHELVHALEDQRFGLDVGEGVRDDEVLAEAALAEGPPPR